MFLQRRNCVPTSISVCYCVCSCRFLFVFFSKLGLARLNDGFLATLRAVTTRATFESLKVHACCVRAHSSAGIYLLSSSDSEGDVYTRSTKLFARPSIVPTSTSICCRLRLRNECISKSAPLIRYHVCSACVLNLPYPCFVCLLAYVPKLVKSYRPE